MARAKERNVNLRSLRRYRTPLALAALCTAMAGYLAWDHKHASSEELAARRRMLFRAFHRQQVDRIEIALPAGRFELRRRGHEQWVMQSEREGARPADAVEVERILSELEGAEALRTLGPLDPASRTRFGLEHPTVTVTAYEGAEITAHFVMGSAVEGARDRYLEASAQDGGRDRAVTAVVVGPSVAEVLDRPMAAFRDKLVASADLAHIDRITLRREGVETELRRRGPIWQLLTPAPVRASRGAVDTLLSELRELRATRVLVDGASDAELARYGLGPTAPRISFSRGANVEPITLRLGGPCPESDDAVTALREGGRTVVCLARTFADPALQPVAQYRDTHVLAARTDEIATIRLSGALGAGRDLVIERAAEGWRARDSAAAIDTDAMEVWLAALHELSSTAAAGPETRVARGLAPAPQQTLEVTRSGVDGSETILVGNSDAAGLAVSRDDEAGVLLFPPSAADVLRVDAVRFRPAQVLSQAPARLTDWRIEAPGFEETITRAEGGMRVTSPASVAVDQTTFAEVTTQFAELQAQRWVGAAERPEYGLTPPRVRIVGRFSPAGGDAGAQPSEVTLRLGAAVPGGGVYAAVSSSDGVFVMPRAFYDLMVQAHADRGVLQVPADVSRVVITVGDNARRVEIVRRGDTWVTASGASASSEQVTALLERLQRVVPPRVFGYGPPPAAANFAHPRAVIEAHLGADGGATVMRVTLGDRFGRGEGAGVYARREGLDLTLSVDDDFAEMVEQFSP